jgi:hypothetical protein
VSADHPSSPIEKTGSLKREAKFIQEISRELQELKEMKLSGLQAHYLRLFGEPTFSKNAVFLRKKLARRIQELSEGGLSERALARIHQLEPKELPEQRPKHPFSGRPRRRVAKNAPEVVQAPPVALERDPRLPPVGSVLRRAFKGIEHEVTVHEEGFFWNGALHKSLSSIARGITGTAWNGFLFFGLVERGQK